MWISKKEYKILKENAEKNIDARATELYLIGKSLKELELLEERIRIIELNEETDITYVKNHMRCMKDDIGHIIANLRAFRKYQTVNKIEVLGGNL